MDESNSTQAHSNYLICMRFIRVSTVGYVPNISRYGTGHLLIIADILWLVSPTVYFELHLTFCGMYMPSKVPDIDCRLHFMILYLGI